MKSLCDESANYFASPLLSRIADHDRGRSRAHVENSQMLSLPGHNTQLRSIPATLNFFEQSGNRDGSCADSLESVPSHRSGDRGPCE